MNRTVFYLNFPISSAGRPVINSMTRNCEIEFNILRAKITPEKGGEMYLELTGTHEQISTAVLYLKSQNVRVEPLENTLSFRKDDCISCGTCTAVCLTGALKVKRPDFRLELDEKKCVVCGACVKACPLRLFTLQAGSKNV